MRLFQAEAKENIFLLHPKALRKKAIAGDPHSQLLIGLNNYYGMNQCVINEEEACKWIVLAAANKDSPARLHAQGLCYAYCIGGITIKNMHKAKEFFFQALMENYIPAMHSLGVVLKDDEDNSVTTSKGETGGIDSEHKVQYINEERRSTIVKLFTASAEAGYPPSMNSLGQCYYNGFGVKTDHNQAFKLFQMAANTGYSQGKDSLGICYRNGNGVTQNNSEARRWFQEAAQQGDTNAALNLENMPFVSCLIL